MRRITTLERIAASLSLLLGEGMNDDPQLSLGLVGPECPSGLVRARWRYLVGCRLPEAAQNTDWPINADHCFARVLLDNVHGVPWRQMVQPPAWRNTSVEQLERAIELGEDLLAGRVDLKRLNDASLAMRKAKR